MAKIIRIVQATPESPEFLFACPGCGFDHWFKTTGGAPRWTWNGSFDRPTLSPSLLVTTPTPGRRCHSFIRDGRIQFLRDCDHALAGQTVDLPEIDT